jgi:plastocyanin domain-containing protein
VRSTGLICLDDSDSFAAEKWLCRRVELTRKIEDIIHVCGAKTIDGLGIITHDRRTFTARKKAQQNTSLQDIRVLILID